MKVELQIKETYEEEKLIVQTPQPTEKVQKVIEFAENLDQKETIKGKIDEQVYLVKIGKIQRFYIENRKVLAETASQTYTIDLRLYQVLEILPTTFIQISQSEIVNIDAISHLKPLSTLCASAATGVLIGLILSIIFSLMYAPNTYAPLSPESLIGQVMVQHQVHGALVLLYCMIIWSAIGVLFSFGSRLFSRDWSLLRATLSHFFLMLAGFVPLATLAGWFPFHWTFYLQLIPEFAIVYLIIWTILYKREAKKVDHINQLLAHKK